MTDEQKQRIRDYQGEYHKNIMQLKNKKIKLQQMLKIL